MTVGGEEKRRSEPFRLQQWKKSAEHTSDALPRCARTRSFARTRSEVTRRRVSVSAGFEVGVQVLPEVRCDKRVRCFCETVQSVAGDAICLSLTGEMRYVCSKQKLATSNIRASVAASAALLSRLFRSYAWHSGVTHSSDLLRGAVDGDRPTTCASQESFN